MWGQNKNTYNCRCIVCKLRVKRASPVQTELVDFFLGLILHFFKEVVNDFRKVFIY